MTRVRALRIGTRQSRLALAQTAIVADALRSAGHEVTLVPMATRGDRISAERPDAGWSDADGQFTRELESALRARDVDLVVHSFKDLPTDVPADLAIAAVPARADARDCLVTRTGGGVDAMALRARVGTSSPRRAAQLRAVRPDIEAVPLRGNVETRLRRLADGEFDGLVLAAAGLDRLGVDVAADARLPYEVMLPAPAQGALAVQIRAADDDVAQAVASLDHAPTRGAVDAERELLRAIGGGCLAPLGTLGEVTNGVLRLRAAFDTGSGDIARADAQGRVEDASEVVRRVALAVTPTVAAGS